MSLFTAQKATNLVTQQRSGGCKEKGLAPTPNFRCERFARPDVISSVELEIDAESGLEGLPNRLADLWIFAALVWQPAL